MKIATYKNSSYCLSFGEDCVFLDIEVEITRLHEQRKEFVANIRSAQLKTGDEEFPLYLLTYFSTEMLSQFRLDLAVRLQAELTPQLFSLFYSCAEIRDSKDDNTTA